MKHALFIHGGPGFNSNPELHLLTEKFFNRGINLHFWNEPSVQRTFGPRFVEEKAYSNLLLSGEKRLEELYSLHGKITLIAHSFGANLATYLGHFASHMIEKIILIAPALNQRATDINILTFTRDDLLESDPLGAQQLTKIISEQKGEFTGSTLEGFFMAAENPKFVTHYWKNLELIGSYYAHGEGEWAFDIKSFSAVKFDFTHWDTDKKVEVPTTVFFSTSDEVVKEGEQLEMMGETFRDLKIRRMENKGHFLHIESPQSIIEELNTISDPQVFA